MHGTVEVWGGVLSNDQFVVAAMNRGDTGNATVQIDWSMLEVSGSAVTFNQLRI